LCDFKVGCRASETCVYPSKSEGSLTLAENCGSVNGDTLKLNKKLLDDVSFNESGLACLFVAKQNAFYLHENGRSQRVHFFDNGCDYFEDGLARGIANGKMVFIDESLQIKLAPGFELLSPFDYGHSVVCNGPFQEERYGEYTFLKGGRCGLINKQGVLVVEAKYNIQNRELFQRYINNNSYCGAPPVISKKSALCHAKRHVSNMDGHTDQWKQYKLARRDGLWLVTFIEEESDEFTLLLNVDTAHWESLTKESHSSAIQRLSNQ